jgi:hypothetical protein
MRRPLPGAAATREQGRPSLVETSDGRSEPAGSCHIVERIRSAGRIPRPDMHVGRRPRWSAATIRARIERGGRP